MSFEPPFERVPMKQAILEASDRHGWKLERGTLDDAEALSNWGAEDRASRSASGPISRS